MYFSIMSLISSGGFNIVKEEKKGYFEAALSDFVFDVAAGGAIRHLADRGHSVEQIMDELSYPVPRAKVEKAFYRYLLESGILIKRLPDENAERQILLLREKTRHRKAYAFYIANPPWYKLQD